MSKIVELREALVAERKSATELIAAGGEDKNFSQEQVEKLQASNKKMTDLRGQIDRLAEVEKIEASVRSAESDLEKPGSKSQSRKEDEARGNYGKTIGQLFVESAAFKGFDVNTRRESYATVDAPWLAGKAVLHTDLVSGTQGTTVYAAGTSSGQVGDTAVFGTSIDTTQASNYWPSRPQYLPMNQYAVPYRIPRLADLIPQSTTSATQVKYMEETATFSNNNARIGTGDNNKAASVLEGRRKPESSLSFTEVTAEVKKLATVLPVTEELLQDVPAAQGFIDQRLRLFLEQEEEDQIINGNPSGTPSDLPGILTRSGLVRVNMSGSTTPLADVIFSEMTRIRVDTGLDPSAIAMHPNVWRDIRLTRTPDGVYIWGNPSEVGLDTLWGMSVVQSKLLVAGATDYKVLVGAFATAMHIYRRTEVSFAVSDSHEDFFVRNMLLLRVEKRLALVHYRQAAFSEIYNITA